MKNIVIWVVLIIIIGVGGYYWFMKSGSNDATQPADGTSMPTQTIRGALLDVTKGDPVRGISTLPTTTGAATASFDGTTYVVNATFTDLPEPQGDDFYEGWIVRKGINFAFESTGPLTNEGARAYSNNFTSSTNYLDYDFYVLTLEPNDNDPAPADHIVEGDLR